MISATTLRTRYRKPTVPVPFDHAAISALAQSMLDSSPDCITLIDLDGQLVYMNDNGQRAMEIDDFDSVENQPWPSIWPKDTRSILQDALDNAAAGEITDFEAYCPTAKGTPCWWHVSVAPVVDESGSVFRIVATLRDITARLHAERSLRERDLQLESYADRLSAELVEKTSLLGRQRVLNAEIDHRVKNSYSLISSMLHMKIRAMGDTAGREALADAANRITTLSRVHEQLQESVDAQEVALKPFLEKLTHDLGVSLADASVIISADIIELSVTSSIAIAVGLVASELVSNALKHGNLEETNKITVSLGETQDRKFLSLRVADTGTGLHHGFDMTTSNGLGTRICQTYAETLDGTLTAQNTSDGAAFTLTFPKPDRPIKRR